MNRMECEYESEAFAATLQSRWPDWVDAELRTHVAGCAICSDVVVIAGSIEEDREEMRARAAVPDSGYMWRLAQLRVRREAAKAAERPITAAQVIAFACAAGLLGACCGAAWTWFHSALGRVTSTVADLPLQQMLPSATTLITEHGALALAVAAVLITIPAAVCLAILKD